MKCGVGYLLEKIKSPKAEKNGLSRPNLWTKALTLIFCYKNYFGWNLAQKVLVDIGLGIYKDFGSKFWSFKGGM